MDWSDGIADRWGGRDGMVGMLLRLFGVGVLGYALVRSGAFTGPVWVAVGTAAALVLSAALVLLRVLRPFGRAVLALLVLLMLLGVVLNPEIDFLGSVFFVIGGILLMGQPEVPLRLGGALVAALTVVLVLRAVLADPQWTVLLSNLFGAAAVVLLGANRRQRVLRLRETARVTELEQRNRIARELHDVLAHSLGGLVVQLDAAGAELERGQTGAAADRVRASRQLAVDGLREARAAVDQLRTSAVPTGPDANQTPAALVDELRTVLQGPVGLQLGVELELVGDERPVPRRVADTVLAVARESLTNINKHAPGSRVAATLVLSAHEVTLEVVNALPDGALLGIEAPELATTGSGQGVLGLRERAASVGGTLRAGAEGRRWVTTVSCPLPGTVGEVR